MQAAGFVVADVRTLDKQQGSYRPGHQHGRSSKTWSSPPTSPTAAWRSASSSKLARRKASGTFVRTHLKQLPVFVSKDGQAEVIAERQNYLLFDRMVAFHVQRGVTVPLSAAEFYAGLAQRFPERDGMYFLPEQVAEYDKKRMTVREVLQLQLFVTDESSAIQWLKQQLIREAADLPGTPPAVPQGDRRLAEAREAAGAVGTAGAELPALRRQGRGARARFTATSPPTSRSCATCPRTTRACAPRPRTAGTCPTRTRPATWRSCARGPCSRSSRSTGRPARSA